MIGALSPVALIPAGIAIRVRAQRATAPSW
jgi:hypothetical protein